jgi:DNA topoisomerase-1
LTTLENRHLAVQGERLRLRFPGKGNLPQQVDISDARLARVIRRCSELPGQRLFQYRDRAGKHHAIGSSDVNQLLQAWMGLDFTAKDFRTWTGSVEFLRAVCHWRGPGRGLANAVQSAARVLGNTAAVCRKHYIHPRLIDRLQDGSLRQAIHRIGRLNDTRDLDSTERLLLRLLPSARAITADVTVSHRKQAASGRRPSKRGRSTANSRVAQRNTSPRTAVSHAP